MSFKSPRLFPGLCWEDSAIDPRTIIINNINQPYQFAFTLKQAMELLWVGQVFSVKGVTSLYNYFSQADITFTATGKDIVNPNSLGELNTMTKEVCYGNAPPIIEGQGIVHYPVGVSQKVEYNVSSVGYNATIIDDFGLLIGVGYPSTLGTYNLRILRWKDPSKNNQEFWFLPISCRIGEVGLGNYTNLNPIPSSKVTIKFLDGSSVSVVGGYNGFVPAYDLSKSTGNIEVSVLTKRQNA